MLPDSARRYTAATPRPATEILLACVSATLKQTPAMQSASAVQVHAQMHHAFGLNSGVKLAQACSAVWTQGPPTGAAAAGRV